MPQVIRVKPFMGTGNRMLQYMMLEAIRDALPDALVSGPGLPEWGIAPTEEHPQQAFAMVLRGHTVPLSQILSLAGQLQHVDLYISALSARLCHYAKQRQRYQTLFPVTSMVPSAGADTLVINLRLAEIVSGFHPNYLPIPIAWYRDLIVQTGLAPLFMGQLGDDAYSLALRRAFPSARFLPSMGPAEDFDFIARATHVALPISTFSWLAAWLSPLVQTIHLPVVGLYHPGARPDHDLLPLDDPRYRFHLSDDLLRWTGSNEQLGALIDGHSSLVEVAPSALAARYPSLGTEGLDAPSWSFRAIDPLTHAL